MQVFVRTSVLYYKHAACLFIVCTSSSIGASGRLLLRCGLSWITLFIVLNQNMSASLAQLDAPSDW